MTPSTCLYLLAAAAILGGCAAPMTAAQRAANSTELNQALAAKSAALTSAEQSPVTETETRQAGLAAMNRRISELRATAGIPVPIPFVVRTQFVRPAEVADYTERARDALTRELKDPSAAQLRDVMFHRSEVPVICGFVNGKNGFGGYTGFRRFYSTDTPGFFEIQGDSPSPNFEATSRALCR